MGFQGAAFPSRYTSAYQEVAIAYSISHSHVAIAIVVANIAHSCDRGITTAVSIMFGLFSQCKRHKVLLTLWLLLLVQIQW